MTLNPFSLLLGLGAVFGLAWVAWQSPEKLTLRSFDQGILLLVGALLGGRLVHVAMTWSYYAEHLLDIPQIWTGGISGVGALIGGLLALGLLAIFTRQPIGELADTYLPLAIVLFVISWLACWLDGCAYGAETTAWYGLPARDEWGELSHRVPAQLLGAVLTLALFWLVDSGRKRFIVPGQAAYLALLGSGLIMLGISFLRVDPSQTWLGWRPEAWAGLSFSLISGLLYLANLIKLRRHVSAARSPVVEDPDNL